MSSERRRSKVSETCRGGVGLPLPKASLWIPGYTQSVVFFEWLNPLSVTFMLKMHTRVHAHVTWISLSRLVCGASTSSREHLPLPNSWHPCHIYMVCGFGYFSYPRGIFPGSELQYNARLQRIYRKLGKPWLELQVTPGSLSLPPPAAQISFSWVFSALRWCMSMFWHRSWR